jgi:asparagine synthase (glutamine-hydrolysing)
MDGLPVEHKNLERLANALTHRGRDGSGIWHQGPVGLVHRLLWTTPESCQEKLPIVSRTGDLVLTADVRIDNREELIGILGFDDHLPGEITDSELILASYQRWGENCPKQLVGDFAWVIWDSRQQTIFGARDHFGVKPFYYYFDGHQILVFASEIKAILSVPGVPHQLNEVMVADYLLPSFDDKTITFYKGILRLPPAHCLRLGREGLKIWSYWSLDPGRELKFKSTREYAEGFHSYFLEAVRARLRSAFPVGAMLSGGLDSSSITCVARHLLATGNGPLLQTFSAIFDKVPESDERPFINAVVAQGNLKPHYTHGDELNPLGSHGETFVHEDEPISTPNLFLVWSIYQAAQQQGVRVLLDGFTGDFVVSYGLEYLPELAIKGKWLTLLKELHGVSKKFQWIHRSPWKIFWHYALQPLVPEPIREVYRRQIKRQGPAWNCDGLIHPEFARRIGLKERFLTLQKEKTLSIHSSRERHFHNLTNGILSFMLEVGSKAAARFGIEPRYPFLDKRLADFCLALPADQKLCQGWTRVIMRRSLASYLPKKVCWRLTKSTLGPNFTRGMLKFARQCLDQVILRDSHIIGEYVDMPTLRQAYHRYASQGSLADELAVWRAVTLAKWLKQTGLAP